MNEISGWLEPVFRWIHVVAGVLWIGLLYFFNWVNGPYQGKIDAETKKKANPELLPRTLYFFRWGAAYTWISGVLLLALVYYHGKLMVGADHADKAGMATIGSFAIVLIAPFIYDGLWKALGKNETAGTVVSYLLLVGVMAALHFGLQVGARALYIHVGSLLGTTMAFNVWFRIWPSQRKIIAGLVDGKPADAAIPALAGLRSKHNTYMSVPLMFTMVSSHFGAFLGFMGDKGWTLLAAVVLVGWAVTKLVYKKSASAAPTLYREQSAATPELGAAP